MSLYALWTVAGTLVVVWLLGISGAFAVGPWIHLMLVAAVGLMATSLFSRPRTV
jgi:hypothetical protein